MRRILCLPLFAALFALSLPGAALAGKAISTDASQPSQQIPSLPGVNVYAVYGGARPGASADEILLGTSASPIFCTQTIGGCGESSVGQWALLGLTDSSGFLAGGGLETLFDPMSLTGLPADIATINLTLKNTATGETYSTSASSGGGNVLAYSYGDGFVWMDMVTRPGTFPAAGGVFNGEAILDQENIAFQETVVDPNKFDYYNDVFVSLIYTTPGSTGTQPGTAVPEPATLFMLSFGLLGMFGLRRRLARRHSRA